MDDRRTIPVIGEQFDADAALQRIAPLAGSQRGAVERKVLYPYFHLTARCSVPTLVGRQRLGLDCLVDGINGIGATADPIFSEPTLVSAELVLPAGIAHEEAVRIARRTVTHRLGRKFRLIAPFDVELQSVGTVYRGFWIVRIGDGRVMVDSVTGAIQSLGAKQSHGANAA